MKTILASPSQQEALYFSLLKDNPYFTGIQIMPFSSWLSTGSDLEADPYPLFSALHHFELVKEKITILKPMLQNPAFIEQVLHFSDQLKIYGIDLDALPVSSSQSQEMKVLIEAVHSIKTNSDLIKEVLDKNETIQDTEVAMTALSSYADYFAAKKLQNRGLMITENRHQPRQVEFFQAQNQRQEIEACAQWIVQHGVPIEDINIILCNPEESFVYLKTIFDYYHLDYGVVNQHSLAKSTEAYLALVEWLEEMNTLQLQKLLKTALFDTHETSGMLEYLNLFGSSFDLFQCCRHVHDHLDKAITLANYQKDYLLQLEENAEAFRIKLLALYQMSSAVSSFEKAYDILRFSSFAEDPAEIKCLIQIQNLLNSTQKSELTKEEKQCVLYSISKIQKSSTSSCHQRICVSDLDHPVLPRKFSFILGASSKNYPGTGTLSGLFEEEYAALIFGFPTKQQRVAFHNQKQEWIFHSASDTLILSYAYSTLEGKGLECAFEVKRFAGCDAANWPLIQNEAYSNMSHSISKASAYQLFVRNQRLHGSVSSFERYWQCPYSYFLHTGLKLRKINQVSLDQAAIGTLQHACIEICIDKYGTNYAEIEKEELKEIVDSQFNQLKDFFIQQKWKIENIAQRCLDSLVLQFEFLNDLEKNTDLVLHQCEVEFHHTLFEESDLPIDLQGFIDRIDANMNLFRIMDYKSSYKNLSDTKIESGLQLQLLTYLIIASRQLNKEALGAYYYSLKNKDIPIAAAKLNLRSNVLSILEEADWKNEWMKEHRLSGKTTSSNMANDHSGTHISGWTEKGPSSRSLNNFDELEQIILKLYEKLKERLMEGRIECSPVESACLFCDFASICRFNGRAVKSNINITEEEGADDNA